jgi:hypothetical protein
LKALKPLPTIESKVTSVIVYARYQQLLQVNAVDTDQSNRSQLLQVNQLITLHVRKQIMSVDRCYLLTINLLLAPLTSESYSLNIPLGNPQLPNFFHSSVDMDKFHKPGGKIVTMDSKYQN